MAGAIAKLSRIRAALEAAKTLNEIVDLRDQAAAIVTYAKAIGLTVENVNAAVEVRLRTERKAGELLASMNLREVRRKNLKSAPKGHQGPSVKLADIGITNHQSKNWQKLAAIPDEHFESLLLAADEQRTELTTASVKRRWAELNKPRNGTVASKPNSLASSLERLHKSIATIYAKWPKEQRPALAAKLRVYAEEIETTGGLAL